MSESERTAYFYANANDRVMAEGRLLVGRCEIYGCREFGLRHYAFKSLSVPEAAKCSRILCAVHAKQTRK
jgi:hypothetical protein